ncbi:uncharacterized protein LOC111137240 [Crassostrea virginica]
MYVQLILILATLTEGGAYFCYECTSLDNSWCTEHFVGKDTSSFSQHVVNCTGDCMKMIVRVTESKYLYVRTCDVSNGFSGSCSVGSFVLGIPTSTVCVCSGDRCNAGSTPQCANSLLFIVMITSLLVVYQSNVIT